MKNTNKGMGLKMRKANILMAFAILAFATSASAQKYGKAGCGLGSIVIGKAGNQILAATTNGTAGSQTFGITSGTSNCAEDGVALAEKEKEYFANANYESLLQEMAQGKGENLVAMASLFGCRSEDFAHSLKDNYGTLVPTVDTGSEALLANVETLVANDRGLRNACSDLN